MAGQYLPTSTVLSWHPTRPFDIAKEVTVTFEVDASWNGRHLVHTRGMRKFARPDLVAVVVGEQAEAAAGLLNALALAQAQGHVLQHGQRVTVAGFGRAQPTGYVAGKNAPEVELGNDALLARLVLDSSGD